MGRTTIGVVGAAERRAIADVAVGRTVTGTGRTEMVVEVVVGRIVVAAAVEGRKVKAIVSQRTEIVELERTLILQAAVGRTMVKDSPAEETWVVGRATSQVCESAPRASGRAAQGGGGCS